MKLDYQRLASYEATRLAELERSLFEAVDRERAERRARREEQQAKKRKKRRRRR
jgi:hypothetical protein